MTTTTTATTTTTTLASQVWPKHRLKEVSISDSTGDDEAWYYPIDSASFPIINPSACNKVRLSGRLLRGSAEASCAQVAWICGLTTTDYYYHYHYHYHYHDYYLPNYLPTYLLLTTTYYLLPTSYYLLPTNYC